MNARRLEQTYYQVLEIAQSAPHQEVVAAYHRAKTTYATDSPALYTMFTKEEAADLRNLIEEAFATLGNQIKRREYDQALLNRNNEFKQDVQEIDALRNTQKKADVQPIKTSALATNNKTGAYEARPDFEKEILEQKNFDGPFLKKVRLYKNISIEHLVKETRIGRSYLNAIEADDFSSLPAPVFLRGFIIQLSRHLGLNENLVVGSYLSRIKRDV